MRHYCLWGGRGRDGWVQVGSSEDRHIQTLARVTAHMMRLRYAMSLMVVATRRTTQSFRELGEAIDRSRTW